MVKRLTRSRNQKFSQDLPVSTTTQLHLAATTRSKNENAQDSTEMAAIDEYVSCIEPTTPPTKRAKKASSKGAPETPTPAVAKQTTMAYSTGDIDDLTPPPRPPDRPAEPHRTNAPLKTPKGSRIVNYASENAASSPSKTGLPRPTTTTGHILGEACAHLTRIDPRLKTVIEKHECRIFSPEGLEEEIDPFCALASGIISQQVSGAAAASIKNKFVRLVHGEPLDGELKQVLAFPTPDQVAACDVPFLRQAGLSQRKAEYINGLAEKFATGELSAQMLLKASDEEVMEKLTAVRGLGRWSVEMFACFGLKRMDVFSTGDLGVQ